MKIEHTFEQNRFRILILSSDVSNVLPLSEITELKSLWIHSSSANRSLTIWLCYLSAEDESIHKLFNSAISDKVTTLLTSIDKIKILKRFFLKVCSTFIYVSGQYGNTGCGVFKRGVQN